MLRIFFILSLLSQLCFSQSALRFIHSHQRKDVQIKKLAIDIEVTEDLTYTTITADFHNTNYYNQEGEMILPLPQGATVCDYKLDVNGEMKDASVVLKAKALKAYEEIKARNVDPGIVEKKNNEYRIRVFPVLPKKTKRMSISYVTRSKAEDGHYHYQLPIKLDDHVGELTVTIIAPNSQLESQHFKLNTPGEATTLNGKNLEDTISLRTPVAKKNTVILEQQKKSKTIAAYYKIFVPDSVPLQKTYLPSKITLLWESSGYLDKKLLAKRLKLLDQYFKKNPNTHIKLYSVGYELKNLGSFQINSGNWSKLKATIKQIKHEGALDFNCLAAIKKTDLKNPIFAVFDKTRYRLLRWNGQLDLEQVIDLQNSTIQNTLESITHQKLRPLLDRDNILGAFDLEKGSRVLQFVSRGLTSDEEISFCYQYEKKPVFKAHFKNSSQRFEINSSSITATIAQHRLNQLISEKQPKVVISNYAIEHRLVSDYTSMIVLETLDDYVKYEIPPRDPETLKLYTARIERGKPQIYSDYQNKKAYHSRDHPWHGYPLVAAMQNIDIWDQSLNRFFLKKHYDQKNHQQLMLWKKRVKENLFNIKKSGTQKEFIKAANTVVKLDDKRKKFYLLPSQYPKDKMIYVSLRGLVRDPKTHVIKPGTDLREFVLAEDSPIVDVYRNSQRITYNLDSKSYKKTPLQSGDMLVITADNQYIRLDYRNLRDQPYLIDPGTDIDKYYYAESASGGSGDPFDDGGSLRSGDYLPPRRSKPTDPPAPEADIKGQTSSSSLPEVESEIQPQQWKKFINQIKETPDSAYTAYLSLRSNIPRDTHFYLKIADVFYQQKLTKQARRVLSNIIANEEANTVAQKRYLFWLMHFGDYQYALTFISIVDPKLTNPDFKFIKLTILQQLDNLSPEEVKSLSRGLTHTFQVPQLAKKPIYDLRVLASAESTGISNFIDIEYLPSKDTKLKLNELSKHGLFGDVKDGIEEHTMKQAIPGIYKIKISNKVIATYRVEIHSRKHDGKITKNIITIHTDGLGGWKVIDSLDFNLP